MSNVIYILHGLTFIDEKRAGAEPFIVSASVQDSLIYQKACKVMLQDLVSSHGKPQRIEKDDDLDDQKIFINQQVVNAFDVYRNTERIKDGPNKGKLKLSWEDRYRRVDAVYEKLRTDPEHQTMAGKYYYITKQSMDIVKKKV